MIQIKRIDPPKSLLKLAEYFHQDVFVIHNTIEEAIEAAVSGLNGSQRVELAAYLDKLFVKAAIPDDLVHIWRRTRSDIRYFGGKSAQYFFKTVLETLKNQA